MLPANGKSPEPLYAFCACAVHCVREHPKRFTQKLAWTVTHQPDAHTSNAFSFSNADKSSSSPAAKELSHLTKPVLKYAIISVNYNVTMITHSRSAHGPYRDRRLSLKSTAKLHKWPKHVVFRLLNKPVKTTKSKPIKIRKLFGNVKQSFEWHDYLLLALTLALIEPTRSFSNYLF